MIRIFSILTILLCLMLDNNANAQSYFEFRLDDSISANLSNHYVGVDYFDDTTIILKCGIYKRGWSIVTDLAPDRKVYGYEYLKYVLNDRINWFIKDEIHVFVPYTKSYTHSPDSKNLIYITRSKDINTAYQHDLVTRERFLVDYPENFWAFGHTWSPTDDIVWVEGGIIDPEEWIGREILKEPTISFHGPTYYLYFPFKKEFKHIFSAERRYSDSHTDMESVWRADGKVVFFKFTFYFGIYGRPDSANAYGAEEYVDFLYKYDLEGDSVILLYAGDELEGRILADQISYDTSIVLSSYSIYQDKKGRTRSKVKQYLSYNPETGMSNKIWSIDDINRPGEVNMVYLSPNRKFIAYYTQDEFVVEVIGDTANPVIYTHPISLGEKRGSADFFDDSRKICFTYKFTDKSKLYDKGMDFGRWYFGWGEIIEK